MKRQVLYLRVLESAVWKSDRREKFAWSRMERVTLGMTEFPFCKPENAKTAERALLFA